MPELPEVETVRLGLANLLIGRKVIKATELESPRSFPNSQADVKEFLIDATIKTVQRRGKLLVIGLNSGYSLAIHLKMTGQLVYRGEETFGAGHPSDSLVGELPDRSTRVFFKFDDGSRLFFNDQRRFGWVKLMPSVAIEELPFIQKLGPEPLDASTKPNDFLERIRRRQNSMIKPAILDQSVIAGVGNIYADESLWASRIHPETRVKDLTDKQLLTLFDEIKKVFRLSIEKGGSSSRNYVDAEGRKGSYLRFAKVFKREGLNCFRHPEQVILKMKVAGRGTHICPVCQKKQEL